MKLSPLELAIVAAGAGPLPVPARQGGRKLCTDATSRTAGYRF